VSAGSDGPDGTNGCVAEGPSNDPVVRPPSYIEGAATEGGTVEVCDCVYVSQAMTNNQMLTMIALAVLSVQCNKTSPKNTLRRPFEACKLSKIEWKACARMRNQKLKALVKRQSRPKVGPVCQQTKSWRRRVSVMEPQLRYQIGVCAA
jgi:hypothetical protein